MFQCRFEGLLLTVFLTVALLQAANGVVLREVDTRNDQQASTSPIPAGSSSSPELVEPAVNEETAPSVNGQTEETAQRPANWFRRTREKFSNRMHRCFRFFVSKRNNDRSRFQNGLVLVSWPVLYAYYKVIQYEALIGLSRRYNALTRKGKQALETYVHVLQKMHEYFFEFMLVSGVLTRLEIFYFLALLLSTTLFAAMKAMWMFKGTMVFLALASPFIIEALDEIKSDSTLLTKPQPKNDRDPELDSSIESKRTTFGLDETAKDSPQQNRTEHEESSTSFWVWISVIITAVVAAISCTSYLVYRKMHRRRFEDVIV